MQELVPEMPAKSLVHAGEPLTIEHLSRTAVRRPLDELVDGHVQGRPAVTAGAVEQFVCRISAGGRVPLEGRIQHFAVLVAFEPDEEGAHVVVKEEGVGLGGEESVQALRGKKV